MEEIVRCMDCGYCDVDSWGAWCNKENAKLNDVCDEHECDSFFPRIEKDASYQQLSKALCGKKNATLEEMLEAVEQLKHRTEPENRPMTLEEISMKADGTVWSLVWYEHRYVLNTMPVLPKSKTETDIIFLHPGTSQEKLGLAIDDYGKIWRCWPQQPTIQEAEAIGWGDEI